MYKKLLNTVASLALMLTTISVMEYCYFVIYQEEVPESAKRLLKKD